MRRLPFIARDEIVAALDVAAAVVAAGGVLLVPTESFYGLAADPRRPKAVEAVEALKDRPPALGLPVLCADWRQIEDLVVVPESYRVRLSRIWPAALTVILPVREQLPAAVGSTLAVRIPDHSGLRTLLYLSGPLTGTSANRHTMPPCVSVDTALTSLMSEPDLALDGGRISGGEPSTIVDLTGADPRIVRPGRVEWDGPYPEC